MSTDDAHDDDPTPDFAALYRDSDVSPRNAAVLWWIGQLCADDAYDDIAEHGDEPVIDGHSDWAVFDELPRITWRQDAAWRRQMARAFDDIVRDAATGSLDVVETPAEEMALYRMMPRCAAAIADGWDPIIGQLAKLPSRADDYEWDSLHERLTHDFDIELLYAPEYDGIEDPDSDPNAFMRMGDYRPRTWFTTFSGRDGRDAARGFRR